jgi:hypothetical protein
LSKLDSSGAPLWTLSFGSGGLQDGLLSWAAVEIGQDGVVVWGAMSGTWTFDGTTIDTHGERDGSLVLRLGADGHVRWSRLIRGLGFLNYQSGISVTSDGGILIAGRTRDFIDAGSGQHFVHRALDHYGGLVALDASGAPKWIRVLDGCYVSDASADSAGNLYLGLGGCPTCLCILGSPGTAGSSMSSAGVAKLDASGNFIWSRSLSGERLTPTVVASPAGVFVGGTLEVPPTDTNGFVALFAP